MHILDIGICVDNQDPKHMGRIRINRYSDQTGVVEGVFKDYEKWGTKDLFVASPLLPANFNFIPEIGQAIKIINYNTDKDSVNMEYISGPFTNMHDFNGQSHTGQLENTSYGSVVKHGPDIIDKNGVYVNPKSEGSFAKHNHYGIYGKYGSDVIFTDDGVMLRGGKFKSKKSQNANEKSVTVDHPIMAEKSSNLYLKKFPSTLENVLQLDIQETLPTGDLKFLIEYELESMDFPTNLNFKFWQLKPDYNKNYRIESSNLSSVPIYSDYSQLITNTSLQYKVQNSTGQTSLVIEVTGITQASSWVRNIISTLHTKGLNNQLTNLTDISGNTLTNKFNYTGDIHPFYFRPTSEFQNLTGNTLDFLNNVNVYSTIQQGLIYRSDQINPQPILNKINREIVKEYDGEQTFAALKSDKVYLISSDTNLSDKKVDFFTLDPYELTQTDYIDNIDKNTYSTVRGENLINVLRAIRDLLESHKHDILEPLEQSDQNFVKLDNLFKTLENDILNSSIRIN